MKIFSKLFKKVLTLVLQPFSMGFVEKRKGKEKEKSMTFDELVVALKTQQDMASSLKVTIDKLKRQILENQRSARWHCANPK